MDDNIKDVTLKIQADTKNATRDLKEVERQVKTLQSLANSGERANGLLTEKQVDLFRNLVKEMDSAYDRHYKKLMSWEDRYAKKVEDRRKKAEEASSIRRNYEGAQANGDRVDEATLTKALMDEKVAEDNYKMAENEQEKVIKSLNSLSLNVQKINAEQYGSDSSVQRIDNMREVSGSSQKLIDGAEKVIASSGIILGVGGLLNYTKEGSDLIREGKISASKVALRTDYDGDDEQARVDARTVGAENQYTQLQTLGLQHTLLSGGGQTQETLAKDTQAIQGMARGYGMDADQLGADATLLQRMGAMDEGGMDRFARLIALAIKDGNMTGREEEAQRSLVNLANSVSTGMASLSESQLSNISGLQSALGQSIPGLSGDRGAEMLQGIDQSIKGGGSNLDVVMGKGFDKFGLVDSWELEMQKSRGISDPQNLIDITTGADRMWGSDTPESKAASGYALKNLLGVSADTVGKMQDSGFIERIMEGDMPTPQEFLDQDIPEMVEQAEQYQASDSKEVLDNISQDEIIKDKTSTPFEYGGRKIKKNLWHNMWDGAQIGAIGVSALGGGMLAKSMLNQGLKSVSPLVKDGAKSVNPVSRAINGVAKGTEAVSKGVNAGTKAVSNTVKAGTGLVAKTGSALTKAGSTALRGVPIAGAAITTGMDRLENPDHDWGRSITKGVGSALGGTLAAAGAVASGLFTGGTSWVATPALAVGGAKLGETVGDGLYSLFNGKEDKEKSKASNNQEAVSTHVEPVAETNVSLEQLKVKNLTIEELGDLSKLVGSGTQDSQEINLNVKLSGGIDGMNEDNEKKVAETLISSLMGTPRVPGMNLAMSFSRGGF